MDQSITEQEEKHLETPNKESRVAIISTVQTPLGFFVLVVLIVEVILGILASFSSGNDKTYLVVGMLALIFLLVLIVAGMAVFRPLSLYGKQTRIRVSSSPVTLPDSQKEIFSSIETVKNPRVLWACNWPDSLGEMMEKDTQVIKQAFPKSALITEKELTADRFRELLTKNKFDIVQLTVNVGHDGSIIFSADERIPSQGVAHLLEVSKTKLLVLACCNSVPLAAELATKTNMIAATGNLAVKGFAAWQSVFYQLLSDGNPLSRAYSVASSTVQSPIVILMKQDVVFTK